MCHAYSYHILRLSTVMLDFQMPDGFFQTGPDLLTIIIIPPGGYSVPATEWLMESVLNNLQERRRRKFY